MDKLYFDIWTCVLYLLVGVMCMFFIRGFMKAPSSINCTSRVTVWHSRLYTILFFLMLLFLAVFRKVTYNLGGSDTINYIDNFQTIFKGGIERQNNSDLEWGFQTITKAIRSLSDNYHVYFMFMYGIIIYGYIKFIKRSCPKGLVYIPFILLMYPFLKSFNTMRTSVAIAFILIGISYMNKSKLLSFFLIAFSVLIHRISLLFVFVWPFYYVMNKRLIEMSRIKFVIVTLVGIVVVFLVSLQFQQYAILYQIADGTDAYYIQATLGQDYLMRYPMFLGQLLLFVFLFLNYNSISWDDKSKSLRTLFIYDLWMVPAGLVLGMWRSIEYLYLVRLSLWAILIYALTQKSSQVVATFIKISFFFVFAAWLIFRIYKEYEDTKISPYILDLF